MARKLHLRAQIFTVGRARSQSGDVLVLALRQDVAFLASEQQESFILSLSVNEIDPVDHGHYGGRRFYCKFSNKYI